MFGCQERGGWVDPDEPWETADPDVVFGSLEKLTGWTDSIYDAVWPHIIEIDIQDLREAREIQKTQLSRYLRLDMFKLEHADIPWIRERMAYLRRVMEMENESSRVTETD